MIAYNDSRFAANMISRLYWYFNTGYLLQITLQLSGGELLTR